MATVILPEAQFQTGAYRTQAAVDNSSAALVEGLGAAALKADQIVATHDYQQDLDREAAAATQVQLEISGAQPVDDAFNPSIRTYGGMQVDTKDDPKYFAALESHRSRLQGIAAASDQGQVSAAVAQARVEQITRDAIARRPGLRNELISIAADTLGFNPLGYSFKTVLNAAEERAKNAAATPEQKAQDWYTQEVERRRLVYQDAMGFPYEQSLSMAKQGVAYELQSKRYGDEVAVLNNMNGITESNLAGLSGSVDSSIISDAQKTLGNLAAIPPDQINAAIKSGQAGRLLTSFINSQTQKIQQMEANLAALPGYDQAGPTGKAVAAMIKSKYDLIDKMRQQFEPLVSVQRAGAAVSWQSEFMKMEALINVRNRVPSQWQDMVTLMGPYLFQMGSSLNVPSVISAVGNAGTAAVGGVPGSFPIPGNVVPPGTGGIGGGSGGVAAPPGGKPLLDTGANKNSLTAIEAYDNPSSTAGDWGAHSVGVSGAVNSFLVSDDTITTLDEPRKAKLVDYIGKLGTAYNLEGSGIKQATGWAMYSQGTVQNELSGIINFTVNNKRATQLAKSTPETATAYAEVAKLRFRDVGAQIIGLGGQPIAGKTVEPNAVPILLGDAIKAEAVGGKVVISVDRSTRPSGSVAASSWDRAARQAASTVQRLADDGLAAMQLNFSMREVTDNAAPRFAAQINGWLKEVR